MIKLSNGVEVSEETVVNALKKAGITTEPVHIFKPGNICFYTSGNKREKSNWRMIVKTKEGIGAVDANGEFIAADMSQESLRDKYEYAGTFYETMTIK